MLGVCAYGPKVFITDTEHPRDEFVLWQEGEQILIMKARGREPYRTLLYRMDWSASSDGSPWGTLTTGGTAIGVWKISPQGSRIEMELTVSNPESSAWEVAEALFCYKHKGAADFWDMDLRRTFVEWEGRAVSLRDRLEALAEGQPPRFKHHLHHPGFPECFERYENVSIRNPETAGWRVHQTATTGGWMAIQSVCGTRISGLYWEGTEMLAQNAPDYGCLHAGAVLGYDIAPGEARTVRGTLNLGAMTLGQFQTAYEADVARWKAEPA